MRRTTTWLVIATLVAMASLLLGGGVFSSELGGENACTEACHEAKAACVEACGTHGNPLECEADCRDRFDDCLRSCP